MGSEPLPPLDELEKKISSARKLSNSPQKQRGDSGFGLALRIGAEFASGVLVGGGFGWMIDKWLDTMPVFFLICFMLGSIAGGLTVYRTVVRLDNSRDKQE